MATLSGRTVEELAVGGYALVATTAGLLSALALGIDAPYVGVFVVFWLGVVCVVGALLTAGVVLVANGRRGLAGSRVDRPSVALAAIVPTAFVGAAYSVLADSVESFLAAIAVGLVIAPIGLLLRVFGAEFSAKVRG